MFIFFMIMTNQAAANSGGGGKMKMCIRDRTSITLKGSEGLAKIQEIMNTLRENAPAEIGGYKVTAVRDYKLDTITDTAAGAVRPTGLPKSNVLYYEMTDGAWVCVRRCV